jgi:hypothetical protein
MKTITLRTRNSWANYIIGKLICVGGGTSYPLPMVKRPTFKRNGERTIIDYHSSMEALGTTVGNKVSLIPRSSSWVPSDAHKKMWGRNQYCQSNP